MNALVSMKSPYLIYDILQCVCTVFRFAGYNYISYLRYVKERHARQDMLYEIYCLL
nr:MAG TPA: hypothetical protein [Caudoviricetes sp.]